MQLCTCLESRQVAAHVHARRHLAPIPGLNTVVGPVVQHGREQLKLLQPKRGCVVGPSEGSLLPFQVTCMPRTPVHIRLHTRRRNRSQRCSGTGSCVQATRTKLQTRCSSPP